MNKFFSSKIMYILPYLGMALMVVIFFILIMQIGVFSEMISNFFTVISPFIIGMMLAYIFNMPCTKIQIVIEKYGNPYAAKKSRLFSVLILFVIIIALITTVLNIIIPTVYSSVLFFIEELPTYEQNLRDLIYYVSNLDFLNFVLEEHLNENGVPIIIQDFGQNLSNFEVIASSIFAGVGGAFSALFRGFLAFVSSIYFLFEKDKLGAFTKRLIAAFAPDKVNELALEYIAKLDSNFRKYIYTQTLDGMILGTLMFIALTAFGSPYALFLGLMLGVLNYIPYFGSIVGTVIAIFLVTFTQGIPTAAFAGVVMFAIQQLDGNVIQPRLMSGSLSVSPLLVIVSVTIGGAYGGVLGMLMAIPVVVVLKDMLCRYIAYKERQKA